MKVRLSKVILAFPNLLEAKQVKPTDKPCFSAAFLFDTDHPAVDELKKAMAAVAKDRWKNKAPEVFKGLKASDRLALHDGASKAHLAGYDGRMYVNANNEMRPLLVDEARRPLNPEDGKLYPGAIVNAVIELWPQDNQHGKRINASLMGVQFVDHGERLAGGGVASEDDFEELPPAEDASGVFDGDEGEGRAAESPADEDDELFS